MGKNRIYVVKTDPGELNNEASEILGCFTDLGTAEKFRFCSSRETVLEYHSLCKAILSIEWEIEKEVTDGN